MLDKVKNVYKFKKVYKKKLKSFKFNDISIGIIGLRARESARLTPKQLEAVRRIVVRRTQRLGRFWLRAFIDQPLTKKSKGSRMGKGAGAIDLWVLDIKAGQIIVEITAPALEIAKTILLAAACKLPITVDYVTKKIFYTLHA